MPDPDKTDADDRMKALFAQDQPPARDPLFSAAVMVRIARRRFQADVAMLACVTGVGGLVLWGLWPTLSPTLIALSQGLAPVAACLTLAAIVTVPLMGGRPGAALGLES
ncbi:hypothetical protein [Phenylobacterium sp.]|uniref:hypothetical protein n=1 Tax=Phenylobacterium sp. TaxID=1871053 RepID=UPI0025F81E36|nr:hypothetical protein [Phenylobacterium sp.]